MGEEPEWHKKFEGGIEKSSTHFDDTSEAQQQLEDRAEEGEAPRYQVWVRVRDEEGEEHYGYSNMRVIRTKEELEDAEREAGARAARASGATTDDLDRMEWSGEGLFIYQARA